ncbi:MAG: hypothetical protein JST16_14680 [Bdellovibrionales bacterium]|nr:hypothetical protein [Bdellovibrionales bacterium]
MTDAGRDIRVDRPPIDSQWGPSINGLVVCGGLAWLCYLAIAVSARSLHESEPHGHGLLVLLALFGAAFGLYLIALRIATSTSHRLLGTVLWVGAFAFRLTLLVSDPIEEIDLYRYVWDGAVTTTGVSPFRYAPQQVLGASVNDPLPEDLHRLVHLRDSSPQLREILGRIHFGELSTIYPPVGQVMFAICSWLTPANSSVAMRLTLMKSWFVAFDLLTLWLILRLLQSTGRHPGWAFAYGWCPLVVKEIANSGHLDSLALCLTTLAMTWMILAVRAKANHQRNRGLVCGAALALSLGVGAKLYPVVLVPLMLWTFCRQIDFKSALLASVVLVASTLAILWPMKPGTIGNSAPFDESSVESLADDLPPLPPPELSVTARDPSESLRAFLSRWEMNDFLFLLVVENLRPSEDLPPNQVAWFTVTPPNWRASLVKSIQRRWMLPAERIPFALARFVLSILYLALACGLALQAQGTPSASTIQDSVSRILEAGFLTLAWFWLLLPTQNPWYLLWCLPLIPFARSRAWHALSGLAFFYYLRFWMTSQFPTPLLGTRYSGSQFFDYIVTWIEFGPWLAFLAMDWIVRRASYERSDRKS